MKITNRNARKDASGKHNDRNFNLSAASYIDPEKCKDNKYWTYAGSHDLSFMDLEKEFYKQHFSDHIKEQNKKNIKARHKERNKTIEQYRKAKLTRPEDKCIKENKKRFNE